MVNPSPEPIKSAFDVRSDLMGALSGWRRALGEPHVTIDDGALGYRGSSTSSSPRQPAAILRPGTREEVSEVIAIARRCRTPLYPISTGQNWGYGDACPVFAGQVIVDLGRMNRISCLDRALGYVVVEPGVTQRQLSDYLKSNDVPFWVDCTGAGPDSSLIGNILERGFGHSPYGNRFQTISGMEVVLGNGDVLRTGFGQFEGAKTSHVYPYGTGPSLDGIFTQSSFGIVTRIGLWLMPIPEAFCPYIVFFERDRDLHDAIAPLRELRMQRVLHSIPHIGNDLRALSSDGSFPRDRLPRSSRLSPRVRQALRREVGVGAWSMSGAFYGPARQVRLQKRLLKRALAPVRAKVIFLPRPLLAAGKLWTRIVGDRSPFRRLEKKIRVGQALANMHSGTPTGAFLKGCYWRHQRGTPEGPPEKIDLVRDRVGILWMAPIIPFTRRDLRVLTREMTQIFEGFGFDDFVTINMINERALAAVYTVAYDAANPAEARRAFRCYEAGVQRLFALGYPLYRASVGGMALLQEKGSDAFRRTVSGLKAALDPEGIIAPGRYDGDPHQSVGSERRGSLSTEMERAC